jgi:isocitrate dehydrogenase
LGVAADLVYDAVEEAIASKRVTYDIHRQIEGGEKLATSEFADIVVKNIESMA